MNQTRIHSVRFSAVNLLVIRMTILIPLNDKREIEATTRQANLTITVSRRRLFVSYELVFPSLYLRHVVRLSCP